MCILSFDNTYENLKCNWFLGVQEEDIVKFIKNIYLNSIVTSIKRALWELAMSQWSFIHFF